MPLHSVDSSLNTLTASCSSHPILPLPSPAPPQSSHSTPKIQKLEEILDQDFLTQGRTLPRASCRQIMGLGTLQTQMCKKGGIFSMTICFKIAQLQSVPIEQEKGTGQRWQGKSYSSIRLGMYELPAVKGMPQRGATFEPAPTQKKNICTKMEPIASLQASLRGWIPRV